MTRCRKLSLVGGSPATSRPSRSSFDNRAGSSRPSEEPVGVISHPSSMRRLIFPEEPAVRPRAKIEAPISHIASRCFASFIAASSPYARSHCESAAARRSIGRGGFVFKITSQAEVYPDARSRMAFSVTAPLNPAAAEWPPSAIRRRWASSQCRPSKKRAGFRLGPSMASRQRAFTVILSGCERGT